MDEILEYEFEIVRKKKVVVADYIKLLNYCLLKFIMEFNDDKYKEMDLFDLEKLNYIDWKDFTSSFSEKEICDLLEIKEKRKGKKQKIIKNIIDKAFALEIKMGSKKKCFPFFIEAIYQENDDMSKNITLRFHPGVLYFAIKSLRQKYEKIEKMIR